MFDTFSIHGQIYDIFTLNVETWMGFLHLSCVFTRNEPSIVLQTLNRQQIFVIQ